MPSGGFHAWETAESALIKVKLPNPVPFLLAGANIGIALAMLSVIVCEFVGSDRGIGYLIVTQSSRMDMAGVMAGIAFLSVAGILFHVCVQELRRHLLHWAADLEVSRPRL